MHPLKQLQKLLNPKSPNHGRVIAMTKETLLIATTKGSQSFPKSIGDVTPYQTGDSVTIVNGQVVGRRRNEPTVYVL